MHVYSHDCMKSYCGRDTSTQPPISVRYPVQLIGEISEIAFGVDTHLPRFEALAHVVPHFDALTQVVIRRHVFLSSKSVFHLFLDPLLKTLFIFFFIVGAAWCFSSGNWYLFCELFVTLVHRWNIGDSLCTSGLFIVFLAVFTSVFFSIYLYM